MTRLEQDLASFVEEAIESPEDKDGIIQDLIDYVRSELAEADEARDEEFIKGAKAALWGKRIRSQGGRNEG